MHRADQAQPVSPVRAETFPGPQQARHALAHAEVAHVQQRLFAAARQLASETTILWRTAKGYRADPAFRHASVHETRAHEFGRDQYVVRRLPLRVFAGVAAFGVLLSPGVFEGSGRKFGPLALHESPDLRVVRRRQVIETTGAVG